MRLGEGSRTRDPKATTSSLRLIVSSSVAGSRTVAGQGTGEPMSAGMNLYAARIQRMSSPTVGRFPVLRIPTR